jgi:NACHT domain- and WD repeat-containing protein
LPERFAQPPGPEDLPPAIVRFQASATEQEIWRGVLAAHCRGEDVVAVLREIENLSEFPSPAAMRDFVDVDETGARDAAAQAALGALKRVLRERLPATSLLEIGGARLVTPADARRPAVNLASGHLPHLCAGVRDKLAALVERQMDEYAGDTGFGGSMKQQLEFERREQQGFAEELAAIASFVGRQRETEAILSYLHDDSRQVLVIHGASGSGKTALLAHAARLAAEQEPVVRFVAATAGSSTVESLLGGICQELRARHPLAAPLPTDARALAREFQEHLTHGTAERPVVVLIDALDQLAGESDADSLEWAAFERLPSHAKLVVSCLSGRASEDQAARPFAALTRRATPDRKFLELGPLSRDEAASLLFERLLPRAARRVNAEQAAAIRANLEQDSCRHPLYLKILFEEARRWSSATAYRR